MANTTYVHGPLIVKKDGQKTVLNVQNSTKDVLLESVTPNLPAGLTNMDDLIKKFGTMAFKSNVNMTDINTIIANSSNISSVSDTGQKITDAFLTKDVQTKVDTLNKKNFVCYDETTEGVAVPESEINDNATSISTTWSSYKISSRLTAIESAIESVVNNTIEKEIKPLISNARTGAVSDVQNMIMAGGYPVAGMIADAYDITMLRGDLIKSIDIDYVDRTSVQFNVTTRNGTEILSNKLNISFLHRVWNGAVKLNVNSSPGTGVRFEIPFGSTLSGYGYCETYLVNGHYNDTEYSGANTFSGLITLQNKYVAGGNSPGYYGGQYIINSNNPYSTNTTERSFRIAIWKLALSNGYSYQVFFMSPVPLTIVVTEVIKLNPLGVV